MAAETHFLKKAKYGGPRRDQSYDAKPVSDFTQITVPSPETNDMIVFYELDSRYFVSDVRIGVDVEFKKGTTAIVEKSALGKIGELTLIDNYQEGVATQTTNAANANYIVATTDVDSGASIAGITGTTAGKLFKPSLVLTYTPNGPFSHIPAQFSATDTATAYAIAFKYTFTTPSGASINKLILRTVVNSGRCTE